MRKKSSERGIIFIYHRVSKQNEAIFNDGITSLKSYVCEKFPQYPYIIFAELKDYHESSFLPVIISLYKNVKKISYIIIEHETRIPISPEVFNELRNMGTTLIITGVKRGNPGQIQRVLNVYLWEYVDYIYSQMSVIFNNITPSKRNVMEMELSNALTSIMDKFSEC